MKVKADIAKVGRPKSEKKREKILSCATDLFLLNGFTNTTMDIVAKEAEVAKQTVYSHFKSKDDLYTAVISAKCHQYRLDAPAEVGKDMPIQDVLMDVANQIIKLLQDPDVIAMYKVVIGEANNYPHVAELFYSAGPLQSVETVANIFRSFYPSKLNANQARAIASDFFNLLKGDFHMRSMLQLPFLLSEEERECVCRRVCKQVSLMIENIAEIPSMDRSRC